MLAVVILTKGKTQGYGVWRFRLWVLAFVGMTERGMTAGVGNAGAAEGGRVA